MILLLKLFLHLLNLPRPMYYRSLFEFINTEALLYFEYASSGLEYIYKRLDHNVFVFVSNFVISTVICLFLLDLSVNGNKHLIFFSLFYYVFYIFLLDLRPFLGWDLLFLGDKWLIPFTICVFATILGQVSTIFYISFNFNPIAHQ